MTSVNANYFNATTKNGVPYHKTNATKKTGVTIGALTSTAALGLGARAVAKEKGIGFFSALKEICKGNRLNILKGFGKNMLIGLIAGAIVDGIVNKVRAKRADKLLETPLLNQQV